MKAKYIALIIIGVVVVGGVGAVLLFTNKPQSTSAPRNVNDTKANAQNQSGSNDSAIATNEVTIQNFSFTPDKITVKKGMTVTWTNKDSVGHTVTGDDKGLSGLDSELLGTNSTFQHTFTAVGTFHYHCTPHPRMTATVVVTE